MTLKMEETLKATTKTYEIGKGCFQTEYSSKGSVDNKMETRACFAETLKEMYSFSQNSFCFINEYTIKVYKEKKGMHCEFVSLEEMQQWLTIINDLISFKWSIEEEDKQYLIKVTIEDVRIIHLFILTCIRYIYEFPFSCLLLWAFKIKETYKEFKDVHMLNIMQVLYTLIYNLCMSGMGHSLPHEDWKGLPYAFYNIEDLKKRLNSKDYKIATCLKDLCGTKGLSLNREQVSKIPRWNKTKQMEIHCINYWEDFSNLDEEYPNILKMYNFILSAM